MPNVDKIVKNVMHEISDGKTALRETMTAALRNQEIVIVQNKHIIDLLEQIKNGLSSNRDECDECGECNDSSSTPTKID